MLMRIVTDDAGVLEIYVSESQVSGVDVGEAVRFYPSVPNLPIMRGVVISVDKTPTRQITRPLFASTYGGGLTSVRDQKDGLIAFDPAFRVLVRPEEGYQGPGYVLRGTVRIETGIRLLSQNFYSRLISIFIRESGF